MRRYGKLILGTRGSTLALAQAEMVKTALEQLSDPPEEVVIKTIKTTGDQRLDLDLAQSGKAFDKGAFTKELEEELLRNEIQIAVHSLKDLPTDLVAGLELGAVLPRHDPSDLLVTKERYRFEDLPRGAILATGSPRRSQQIKWRRPDLITIGVRGNIGTRLEKLCCNQDWTGLVLAKAGMDRIGFRGVSGQFDFLGAQLYVEPLTEMIPAAGQGAIGLEIASANRAIKPLLEAVNDVQTWDSVCAERDFLRLLGGGCQVPIGVHGVFINDQFQLEAIVFEGIGTAKKASVTGVAPKAAASVLIEKFYGKTR
jgi:hydroxymethylbilane synthase